MFFREGNVGYESRPCGVTYGISDPVHASLATGVRLVKSHCLDSILR